jgi:hypothetical protein
MATRIAAEPTSSMRVSFIAAYCLSPTEKRFHTYAKGPFAGTVWLEPQMPMSRYIGSTASS